MCPFACHGWTCDVGRFHRGQELNELFRLRGRNQITLLAIHVLLANQSIDRVRARRRRAESALLHCFGQFFILDEFSRCLHREEQRRFCVTRRRFRRLGSQRGVERFRLAVILCAQRRQRLALRGVVIDRALAVNLPPTS